MIDTHSHLFVEEFADDLPEVIARAQAAGVTRVLMPNIDETTIDDMLRVCAGYPDYCYPMLGFHPTSVDADWRVRMSGMKQRLMEPHPYIAIGEVGMDLYWDKTFLREQQRVLDEQIGWALEYRLPLVLHCREAFSELFEVLRPYRDSGLGGVFHSFTGTAEEAQQVMEFERFKIGVNGVLTFKKSNLPQVLASVPLERIVVETDSPYLAPVPFRGKRNESAYVGKVVARLAEVYGVSEAMVDAVTTENALKVFNLTE